MPLAELNITPWGINVGLLGLAANVVVLIGVSLFKETAVSSNPVLIAGAGPTGLVLALSLARRGVPFRLIDDGAGPGEFSRAMVVQARTFEFYRQFGFADEMVKAGIVIHRVHMRELGRDGKPHEVLSLEFNDLGAGISPYPFALTYPQDDHERFLTAKLAAMGIAVSGTQSHRLRAKRPA